jgi:hypothetical protein
MRRVSSHLFPVIWVVLLFSALSYGQTWSGILAPSRAIDWTHAGLPATFPDGETTVNPWTPPARTQCGSTLGPLGSGQDDQPQISSAISSCTTGHYVLLGPGTFTVNSKLALDGALNVSLRGSGAQNTKVHIGSSGSITLGDAYGTGTCALTSGTNYSQGTTSIICSGSQPPTGTVGFLAQCDTGMSGSSCLTGTEADNGSVWICGEQTICSNQNASGGHEHEQQAVLISAVSGSGPYTVTISPGLYMANWAYTSSPTLTWNNPSYTAVGIGFEDLTVDFTAGTTSNNGGFSINYAYASWIKGVRFIGNDASSCCVLYLENSGQSLFMNNYVFTTNPFSGTNGTGSGLPVQPGHHSAALFLNNFIQGGGITSMEIQGWDSGNVYAFNYARDNVTTQVYNGDAEHSASPNFELKEGNQYAFSDDDYTWGTHNFDTWFRNYFSCNDLPYAGLPAPKGIIIDNYARFENAVGNAVGGTGCTAYQGYGESLYEFAFGAIDSLALTTSMRWGNYSTATGTVHWTPSEVPSNLPSPNTAYSNPVPSTQTLPPSFFLPTTAHADGGTGLSWWKVCTTWTTFPTSCSESQTQPFPPIGPDVTGGNNISGYAYDVPAAVAYKNLPIDTNYQQSYTITASGWSSGTETLTVSGLPNPANHLMGGFQLSGVPAACLPTSGVSYTGRADGELLMTGSSTTTISYALASNPGTSCGGTMKWPDVRQFDEQVYENDPNSDPPPAPPTNLNAQVD